MRTLSVPSRTLCLTLEVVNGDIWFLGALKIAWVTSSPNDIIEGKSKDLQCYFSGRPLPQEVHWYKDGVDYEQSLCFLIVRRERSEEKRPRESWPRESYKKTKGLLLV